MWLFGGGEAMSLLAGLLAEMENTPAPRFHAPQNVAHNMTTDSLEIVDATSGQQPHPPTVLRMKAGNPAWIDRAQPPDHMAQTLQLVDQLDYEPRHLIRSAVTASSEWLLVRDSYINHLMSCRACHAPTGRCCAAGAALRQHYDQTPMEHAQ